MATPSGSPASDGAAAEDEGGASPSEGRAAAEQGREAPRGGSSSGPRGRGTGQGGPRGGSVGGPRIPQRRAGRPARPRRRAGRLRGGSIAGPRGRGGGQGGPSAAAGYAFRAPSLGDELALAFGCDLSEGAEAAVSTCLAFVRDRPDLLRSLPKKDVEVLVANASPVLFKDGESSAQRLRHYLAGEETDLGLSSLENTSRKKGKRGSCNSGASKRSRSGSNKSESHSVELPMSKDKPEIPNKLKGKRRKKKVVANDGKNIFLQLDSPASGTRSKKLQSSSPALSTRSKRRLSL